MLSLKQKVAIVIGIYYKSMNMFFCCIQDALVARYSALDKPMAIRKRRLLDSLQAQQLFRDLDDEAAWIREKEPIIASTNRGEL